jgi:hypothetical protein
LTRRIPLLAVGLVAIVGLTACGQATGAGSDVSGFDKRAAAVAAAWRSSGAIEAWRTGLVPLGEFSQVLGFDDRSDLKDAFAAGRIGVDGTLPDTTSMGEVRFPDGSTKPVGVVGARTAYTAFTVAGERPCPTDARCSGVVITGATLGTTTLLTSRGEATVPAWRFSVAGLTQPIIRVAIDPAAMTVPPAPTLDAGDGRPRTDLGVEVGALLGVSGNEIRYQLLVGACDSEPRRLLHEEADIIVVGGAVSPSPPNQACTANLIAVPVSLITAKPVGDRPIVEAIFGRAVVVRRFPVG